jgi:hypothetical protein
MRLNMRTNLFNKAFSRFRTDKNGQFSIMMAVALPMLMACVGMATDVTHQIGERSSLQNAVDAAALSGSATASNGGSEQDVRDQVLAYFEGSCDVQNCASIPLTTVILPDRIRVEADGSVKAHFMGMMGMPYLPIAARAEVMIRSTPVHYEVHMVLDNSGSMNIIDGLANIRAFRTQFHPWNASACAFACHDRGGDGKGVQNAQPGGATGASLARSLGFPMREDRLRAQMIEQSRSLLTSAQNQSRIKVATYDFDWWVRQRIAPSANFAEVRSSIETMPEQSGGTQYSFFANELARLVGASGSGADAGNPKKAIVMITDGVSQTLSGSHLETIPVATCNKLKEEGRELFVLNMVYPDPNEIGDMSAATKTKILNLVPQLEPSLIACASPGRYYSAEYGASIDSALESIRLAILKDARSMYLSM